MEIKKKEVKSASQNLQVSEAGGKGGLLSAMLSPKLYEKLHEMYGETDTLWFNLKDNTKEKLKFKHLGNASYKNEQQIMDEIDDFAAKCFEESEDGYMYMKIKREAARGFYDTGHIQIYSVELVGGQNC